MSRRLKGMLIAVTLTLAAGCHGSCRHSPGPAFIDRRPPAVADLAYRPGMDPDDMEPLSPRRRTHPLIGRLHGEGSLSIGTATRGFLVSGRELPTAGTFHRVMKEQAGRATNFGTDELVAAIMQAAADVAARYPGSILPVGNLSRGGGGEIRWSISHKSGRDADIGFYLRGGDGSPVFQESMTVIGRDGTTVLPDGSVATFDAPRTWLLVKSLLTRRDVAIQWIFMADHLKERLLDYARSRKESRRIVELADEAIAQPRGRSHDDHIHVRIYCSADDILEGCSDMGTNRPWYTPPGPRLSRRRAELTRLVHSSDPAARRDAVEVLGHLGGGPSARLVASRLGDPDGEVRLAAAEAMAWMGFSGFEAQVAAAILDPATPDHIADRLLLMVETSPYAQVRAKVLSRLVGSDRTLAADNGVFVKVSVVGDRASALAGKVD